MGERIGAHTERPYESSRPDGFKVGDRVTIVRGHEAGKSGVIVQILEINRGGRVIEKGRYAVEVGSGQRTYCAEIDMMHWVP
jgi:hypothetical protein